MAAVTATLCSTLLFVFVSAEQKNITAEFGQNVTLTCRTPNNIIGVKWSRADLGEEYVLFYRNGWLDPDNQHPSFKNRVDLQDRQMKDGNVSVILKNVTINDEGTYECGVFEIGANQRKLLSIIYLRVAPPGPGGGTTEDGGKEDGRKEDRGKEEDGFLGLIVGLSVSALLIVVCVVGFLIYRKRKNKPDEASYQPPPEQQQL
ncbi:programmed cell death 1 ligand 1-like [Archocentrus centrarchus]|uniref:programmed cell death 1 ligand 1-like n=1 Tax=Archocentrus centrarchus TaxID=63155 RepID=UPI0011E9DF95|nr:programmed cell death 1 ligand 1-like [Archocentrus centrarchus]